MPILMQILGSLVWDDTMNLTICILTGYVNAKINKSGIYRPKMLWKTEDGGHRSWSQSNSLPSTEVK